MVNFSLRLLIWVSSVSCLFGISIGYNPKDNYLIDCGSLTNTSVDNRTFIADNSASYSLSTPVDIFATASSNLTFSTDSPLYQTARIFNATSHYTFSIKSKGRHWIRLHFFPFEHEKYNMTVAKFSVSAQHFTFLRELQLGSVSLVKEYCLNITSDQLILTFTPSANSFAFINALEVFSLPDDLIPRDATIVGSNGHSKTLSDQALETVARVNMGNVTVSPKNDALWRLWVSDDPYLVHNKLGTFIVNVTVVNFTEAMENVAPLAVYGTATRLISELDPLMRANLTWTLDVDPGFEYLVRLHFCDLVSNPGQQGLFLSVYINSQFAQHIDLLDSTSDVLHAPYYLDVVTSVKRGQTLNISVGPSSVVEYPSAILNGLEVMKISSSGGSLDVLDVASSRGSKTKIIVAIGAAAGLFFFAVLVAALILLRRRRKLTKYSQAEEHFVEDGGVHATENTYSNGMALFSHSKFGYYFPFAAIQEATDNFSENLLIGVGGFGKVYKGLLRDETVVAVKRGASQSNQGLAEFKTEIEMLSQFRHRHLVSLIGYCDERNELIIIYEHMENGTLKNHLYGSNLPSLSWRQRLEICIGSARGLHYLHTGSTKAIIHRDVKSANILLDENLMAKVADFGLSRTGPEIDKTHVSTAVKGSFGYLDPEYLTTQQLTEKSDVYSFGVVMLEVLCGRPVIDPSLPREKVNLVEWAMQPLKKGELDDIIDPILVGQIKPESLKKFGEITEKCLARHGTDRHSMGDVLWNLEYVLQLQGNEGRSNRNGELSSEVSHVNSSQTSQCSGEFSMASVEDITAVSMSKVFAQMVKEETK